MVEKMAEKKGTKDSMKCDKEKEIKPNKKKVRKATCKREVEKLQIKTKEKKEKI